LQDLCSTTLGHARGAVHDEVFEQPPLIRDGRGDRERDARVAAEVSELPLVRESGKDDLVAIEPDPRGRHVRPSVFIECDHMRDRVALEKCAGCAVEVDPGHGLMLSIGRVGL
jgi:hypothetical protein